MFRFSTGRVIVCILGGLVFTFGAASMSIVPHQLLASSEPYTGALIAAFGGIVTLFAATGAPPPPKPEWRSSHTFQRRGPVYLLLNTKLPTAVYQVVLEWEESVHTWRRPSQDIVVTSEGARLYLGRNTQNHAVTFRVTIYGPRGVTARFSLGKPAAKDEYDCSTRWVG